MVSQDGEMWEQVGAWHAVDKKTPALNIDSHHVCAEDVLE